MADDVEVLIVSYDSASALATCLPSLASKAPGVAVAIREHGDASAFARLVEVCATHAGVTRFDHDPTNPGFGAGCNALAETSDATILLFLNADTELVTWPWVAAAPPRGTIVGPLMVDSGDPSRHYGQSYRLRDEIGRSWFRRRSSPPAGRGFVSGAALLVDAASFRSLHGFDGGFFMYYEDIDLCRRANDAGIETRLEPAWTVRHAGAHSTSTRFGESVMWSYESARRFHGAAGTSPRLHSAYVIADSVARTVWNAIRRDWRRAASYASLARRASRDLVSG